MANKIQELRSLSEKELISMKQQLQEKIMQIRFKSRIERPKNIMEIRSIKRTIAQINTLIREAELKLEG